MVLTFTTVIFGILDVAKSHGASTPLIVRRPVPVAADQQHWNGTNYFLPLNEAQVDRLISNLQASNTRLAALSELLGFLVSARFAGDGKDAPGREIWSKASDAVIALEGIETVVTQLTAQLVQPDRRIGALTALIRIAAKGPLHLGSVFGPGTGKPAFDDAAREAGLAVNRAVSPNLLAQALEHPDRDVRWWAVQHFGSEQFPREVWVPFLPRVERIAAEDDANLRWLAAERLKWFPSSRSFLDERLEREPSPGVLMRLLLDRRSAVNDSYRREFLELFHPLLTNTNASIRIEALNFIQTDRGRAPMWQFPYDRRVFDRVVEMTKSALTNERAPAVAALAGIQGVDRDTSRQVFLDRASDSVAAVRSAAGGGLAAQRNEPDAKAALEKLLNDPSPLVQWWIITYLGPDEFEEQLKTLAYGNDKQVARLAENSLKGIEYRKHRK